MNIQPSITPLQERALLIRDGVLEDGGISLDSRGLIPLSGYMAADGNDSNRVVMPFARFKSITLDGIINWLCRAGVRRAMEDGGAYAGAWHDRESGLVFLETSLRFGSLDAALAHARAHSQRYVYDVSAGKDVPVNVQ